MILRIITSFFLIILSFFFIGCSQHDRTFEDLERSLGVTASNFWIKKYPEAVAEDGAAPQNHGINAQENHFSYANSAVEFIWLVPEGRVSKYILRYGTSEDNLNSSVELFTKNLTPIMHPKFGKVYKHIIMGVPANARIYYSLQAGNELGLSDPTPIASEMSREN